MGTVTHDELPRRRPVWEGMSALFLDTDLDDSQLGGIAETFRASGYTEAELDHILDTEVAPLLYPNLCLWVTVAGVWDGFDLDQIEAEILAGRHLSIRRWYSFGSRWVCNSILRGVKSQYWNRIIERMRAADSSTCD